MMAHRLTRFSQIAASGLVLAVSGMSAPAIANTDDTSSGNQVTNGAAGSGDFEFDEIAIANEENTGVFISQIGETNRAETNQQSSSSYSRIAQNGQENEADVLQGASGKHHSNIAQDGEDNTVLALQDGLGQNRLLLGQEGDGNSATISQSDNGLLYSSAAVLQSGNGNSLVLVQDGDDNQARLTQNGDNNAMTATQLDAGNRLEWTQDGTGLSDLEITQTGGAAISITQSNGGG